jgi:hypothetical protein
MAFLGARRLAGGRMLAAIVEDMPRYWHPDRRIDK